MVEQTAVGGATAWDRDGLKQEDWVLGPTAVDLVARVDRCLRSGPGVAVVRGVELDGLDDEECAELCRRLVARVGRVRPHDCGARRDHLVDAGAAGSSELGPHTDRAGFPGPPRLLALLCIRPALHGGESLLVSGHAVHDQLLAGRPAVLQHLYQDFNFGRGPGFERIYPVFRRTAGSMRVQYNRYWIGRGRHESGVPFSAGRTAALDAFDEVLADPRMVVRLQLRRGDLLLLDNTVVLHGRTAFTDPQLPRPQRCLARVWAD